MEKICESGDHITKLKFSVQRKFSELRAALHMRETLLLRQLDAVASTQQQDMGLGTTSKVYVAKSKADDTSDENVKFIVEQEAELLSAIRTFGRFQLGNMQLALKQEDYIAPTNDHETMYKCLLQSNENYRHEIQFDGIEKEQEAIVVDLSKDKSIIEHNTKHMNESIVNITLQEAKELIRKARNRRETPIPPLNLEELDDELESSIAEAVSSISHEPFSAKRADLHKDNTKSSKPLEPPKKSKSDRFKPEITINNCNGTINLRNISTLTINCGRDEATNVNIPLDFKLRRPERDYNANKNVCVAADEQYENTQMDNESTQNSTSSSVTTSNYSSSASSRSQSRKQKANQKSTEQDSNGANTDAGNQSFDINDDDARDITCDFYNRLLNEIKNSLKQQQLQTSKRAGARDLKADTVAASSKTKPAKAENNFLLDQRLVLHNFENLKVVLEANSEEDSARPVQIEQWLAEIIMDTDLEPMQNTDILEHSKINESASDN